MASFDRTRCDNPHCGGADFCPDPSSGPAAGRYAGDSICPVCLEELQGKEMGFLSDCMHVCCSSCICKWKGDKWGYRCPYCRLHSNDIVLARRPPFSAADKRRMFASHAACFKNDPILDGFLTAAGGPWRRLVETLLVQTDRLVDPLLAIEYADSRQYEIVHWNTKYAVYHRRNKGTHRVVVYLSMAGLHFQVVLSTSQLTDLRMDSDYADRAVDWLAGQLRDSPGALPHLLNPSFDEFIVWSQRCRRITCALYLGRNEHTMPPRVALEIERSPFGRLLGSMPEHNFPDVHRQGAPKMPSEEEEEEEEEEEPMDEGYEVVEEGGEEEKAKELWRGEEEENDGLLSRLAFEFFMIVDLVQIIDMKNVDLCSLGIDLTPWL